MTSQCLELWHSLYCDLFSCSSAQYSFLPFTSPQSFASVKMDLGRPIPADEAATMPIGQNDAPAHVVATPAQAGHVDSPDVPRPIPVAQLPTDASTETRHVQDHSTHPPHRPSSISEPPTSGVTVAPTHAAPVRPTQQAPTSTIDPNIPSSESAPTALPTNPATEPGEQKEALKDEPRTVIKREVEKTKAAEREIKGEKPKGTIIHGLEDDRLYAMLRRFDTVSLPTYTEASTRLIE